MISHLQHIFSIRYHTCTLTNIETTPENKQENIKNICKQYAQHASIIKIKERVASEGTFSVHSVTLQEMDEEIMNLEHNKAMPHNDINVLKGCLDILSRYFQKVFNASIIHSRFPNK